MPPKWSHEFAGSTSEARFTETSADVRAIADRLGSTPNPRARRTHEVLQPDVPASPFIDIDLKDGAGTEADADAIQAAFIAGVETALGLEAGAVHPRDVEVFVGSRGQKVSRHVIVCGIALPSLAHVAALVSSLPPMPGIDAGVYRTGRTFRAPFCCAWHSKTESLKPPIGGEAFDARRFERGLVHRWNVEESATTTVIDLPPLLGNFPRSASAFGGGGNSTSAWATPEVCDRVLAWLAEGGATAARAERGGPTTIEFSVSGLPCVVKQAPHESNRTFVSVQLPAYPVSWGDLGEGGTGKFTPPRLVAHAHATCADPDCGGARWYLGDLGFLLRGSEP